MAEISSNQQIELSQGVENPISQFFKALYGNNAPGFLTICDLKTRKTSWFSGNQTEEAVKCVSLMANHTDVYFGLGLRKERKGEYKRGESDDVIAIPGLWLDVDLAGTVHKKEGLPRDLSTVSEILKGFSLPPTLLIDSGHGIYPFWLFDELLVFSSQDDRKAAQELLSGFHNFMRNLFRESGYAIDNTSDMARVLRIPGTINYKAEPVPVKILEFYPDRRYSLKSIKQALVLDTTEEREITKEHPDYQTAKASLIGERCPFLKHCIDDAESLAEADWYFGLVSIISRTVEGPEQVHEWSRPYPNYIYQQTEAKIKHALKDAGPTTCKTIREKCGDKFCRECRFWGHIKSPLVLGVDKSRPSKKGTAPFPLEVLPPVFRNYIEQASKSLCCPPDYVAVPLLTCAGGIVGSSRRAVLKEDWEEGTGIYSGTVGDPASKKSPALSKGVKFARELAKGQADQHSQALEDFEREMAQYEQAQQMWKARAKESLKNPAIQAGEKPYQPEEPRMNRLIVSDTTVEALASRLADNPKGLILIRDELSGWVSSFNAYKQGRGSDKQFYLSTWSNDEVVVDRKGEQPIVLSNPNLAVTGCLTPDVLGDIRKGSLDDGFIERILLAYPDPVKQRWSNSSIDKATDESVRQCFQRLFQVRESTGEEPVRLALTSPAREVFIRWVNSHYSELDSPGFPNALRGIWGKIPGQAARLALIVHLIRQVTEHAGSLLDRESILAGIILAEYFKDHSKKVFAVINKDPSEEQIQKALNRLVQRDIITVDSRYLVTYKVCGCKKTNEARELLDLLYDAGYGLWSLDGKTFVFYS